MSTGPAKTSPTPPSPLVQVTNLEFLKAMFAGAPADSTPWVTGFPECPNQAKGNRWSGLALHWDAPTPACLTEISWNTYAGVGTYRGRRKIERLASIHALFIDDVGSKGQKLSPSSLPLPPSYLVETAPGNFQVLYFLSDPQQVSLDDWRRVEDRLATIGDKGVKDLARYFRLPVGRNTKTAYSQPFEHRVHVYEPSRRYTVAEVERAFEPLTGAGIEPQETPGAPEPWTGEKAGHREWLNDIHTGENFHESLVRLAARYVAKGHPRGEIVTVLQALMKDTEHPHDERWQSRYDRIPECVDSAIAKGFGDPGAGTMVRTPGPPPTFEFLDYAELLAEPAPPVWLVDEILECPVLGIVYGESDTYKSFILIDMGLHIAAGRAWHGHDVTQGPVALIAGEGHYGIRRRIKAWSIHHQCQTELAFLVSKVAASLDQPESFTSVVEALTATTQRFGPLALVLIDTLHMNMAGDDGKPADAGEFMRAIRDLRDSFGCSVVVIHHVGHAEKDRERGAYNIRAGMDARILVHRVSEHPPVSTLHCRKMKDGPRFTPLEARLAVVETGWLDAKGRPVSSLVVDRVEAGEPGLLGSREVKKAITENQRELLDLLQQLYQIQRRNLEQGGHAPAMALVTEEDWQALGASKGITRARFYERRDALRRRKLINVNGPHVTLTALGEAIAGARTTGPNP